MQKLNVVFLGGFPYPRGMAATKDMQNAIDGLKRFENTHIRVVVLRQNRVQNDPAGTYQGVPYETVMPDLMRIKVALFAPLLFIKSRRAMRKAFIPGAKNVLFVYGPPDFDNLGAVRIARKLGYKVAFNIVEDDEAAIRISASFYQRIKNINIRRVTKRIESLADGIIVISSFLEKKCAALTRNSIPIHFRPVSVNFSRFVDASPSLSSEPALFYAGSFGVKDGVENLLDAFEILAARHPNMRLILTGKGSDQDMEPKLRKIAQSSFSNRIDYKGYLDDDSYYALLQKVDIPCMTRIDLDYANAGFPFKLGEFLATGKPVIASRVSDVERFLKDKHDALLVKPGSVNDIVGAAEFIMENMEAARQIGIRARECAFKHFDFRVQAQPLYDFLQSL